MRKWTLSSSLESDFAFSHDVAKFYQPHSAQQLPNGDLLLLDDGNDRPGCVPDGFSSSRGCFTAACAAIDGTEKRPVQRWVNEVLAPSGWKFARASNTFMSASMSMTDFQQTVTQSMQSGGLVLLPASGPPRV